MRFKLFFLLIIFISTLACSDQSRSNLSKEKPQSIDSLSFELPPLPVKVNLFEAKVELKDFDLKERLDKELIVNTYYHSSTIQAIKRANRFFPQIEEILF